MGNRIGRCQECKKIKLLKRSNVGESKKVFCSSKCQSHTILKSLNMPLPVKNNSSKDNNLCRNYV